jgi:hypothetical protein
MRIVLLIMLLVTALAHAQAIPDKYEPFLSSYKSCMSIFNQEKRLSCLEERIDGLQALSVHRNGEDGAKATNDLSIKECGVQRSTDALLCRIRVIDFWIH